MEIFAIKIKQSVAQFKKGEIYYAQKHVIANMFNKYGFEFFENLGQQEVL